MVDDQIRWALDHGFVEMKLDACELVLADDAEKIFETIASTATKKLQGGKNVILHTGGSSEPSTVAMTRQAVAQSLGGHVDVQAETGRRLGAAFGKLARLCLEQTRVARLCVAGGDTASHIARQLGIESLRMVVAVDAWRTDLRGSRAGCGSRRR